ncbi:hypothetical protein F4819DRAFT_386504 [Hypoxylon fuscum]|nr:hypothetical protein F4819DRAFT_386504 [Hypoxylon fuscum]
MPFASIGSAYVLGAGSVFLGLHCFIRPKKEYGRFGLPLESPPQQKGTADVGSVSPLIYLKGIREITYGLALGVLQYQGQDDAVTTIAGIISLAGLGDGIVIWLNGGDEFKHMAFGHWGSFVALAVWSLRRATS